MSTLAELRGGLERLWDSLTEGWRYLASRASGALTRFSPARSKEGEQLPEAVGSGWGLLTAELYEDDEHVEVRLEAPGMEPADFDVSICEDMLIVRGEKRYQRERDIDGYRIAECAYGAFERAIPLPEGVDEAHVRARYRRGVLHIEMPRKALSRPRRIEITG